ncbi:MAG TPA: AAA domain-containing protein [Archangium sp.]|jgi:hypothetical protein|uniref:AAA domain-containing protein n=1 Tax=Archangium sp. TaxID=1872627 RepID=UPI002ED8DD51
MKALHFAALAPDRVAQALQGQAADNLRPFSNYLKAAIESAERRQIRSKVPWKVAEEPPRIRLRALDSVFELEPRPTRFRVTPWPENVKPDVSLPLMVVSRNKLVAVQSVEFSPEGPLITVDDESLGPKDNVYWCGQPCQCHPISDQEGVEALHDDSGRPLPIRDRKPHEGRVRLVIEGESVAKLLDAAGRVVEARGVEVTEGLLLLQDSAGAQWPWHGRLELDVPSLPAEGVLVGDNGVRFAWEPVRGRGRRPKKGTWVQLLPPEEVEADMLVDPRVAFCEEKISSVRTQPRADPEHVFRVLDFDRGTYQLLLERLPPKRTLLHLPVDVRQLRRQRSAVETLRNEPLPHHRGLLRLVEDPTKVRWEPVRPEPVASWYVLQDERWSGTSAQREFVAKALGTPDFAFLEGPPGSGKTHAICELVLQLIARGERVLLCSTTNVAVDNVLERLDSTKYPQVEAVRIGRADRVDPSVLSRQLDTRIEMLVEQWREDPSFARFGQEELQDMAGRTVLASVNFTCGTTNGIINHPSLHGGEGGRAPTRGPLFDTLILDETSKTPFQEFLVPALLARRWILVGDVRQLPPFNERGELEAGLQDVSNEQDQRFSPSHQRACLLIQRLTRPTLVRTQTRWLLVEDSSTLDCFHREWVRRASASDVKGLDVLRLVMGRARAREPGYQELSVSELMKGGATALRLLTAGVVLVERASWPEVERWLPPDLCRSHLEVEDAGVFGYRRRRWLQRAGTLQRELSERGERISTAEELELYEGRFLVRQSWAQEVAWRLIRVHELGSARGHQERQRREDELRLLLPHAEPEAPWVRAAVESVQDVGLRSVLEMVQEGASAERSGRHCALTEGVPKPAWRDRAVLLTYQHRMHPEISALPRELFYERQALQDANTLEGREQRNGWSFEPGLPSRRSWVDVRGREREGANPDEVKAMRDVLELFLAWARVHPRSDRRWEVACLAFYVRQEGAIRDMLRELTGQRDSSTRFEHPAAELSCGTVDRFQGREADLVLLSLRNTERVGFLNSPNRLNVAITRARHLLVLLGNRDYYLRRCGTEELMELARHSPPWRSPSRRGRG